MKTKIVILLVSLLLSACAGVAKAGKAFCPPGQDFCYTARHLITGELHCFPGVASNTENENKNGGWSYVEEGCAFEKPEEPENPVFQPTIVMVTPTPLSTPTPALSTSYTEPIATAVPGFIQAQPTACDRCTDPVDCVCLLVTQAVIENSWLATMVAIQEEK